MFKYVFLLISISFLLIACTGIKSFEGRLNSIKDNLFST